MGEREEGMVLYSMLSLLLCSSSILRGIRRKTEKKKKEAKKERRGRGDGYPASCLTFELDTAADSYNGGGKGKNIFGEKKRRRGGGEKP